MPTLRAISYLYFCLFLGVSLSSWAAKDASQVDLRELIHFPDQQDLDGGETLAMAGNLFTTPESIDSDPFGAIADQLEFSLTQVSGEPIVIRDPNSSSATFAAPKLRVEKIAHLKVSIRSKTQTVEKTIPVRIRPERLENIDIATTQWHALANAFDRKRMDEFGAAVTVSARGALEELWREQGNYAIRQSETDFGQILESPLQAFDDAAPLGQWKCRTWKLDERGIVRYNNFRCQFRQRDGKLFFEKLSGSQRTSGYLYRAADDHMVYLGAGTVNEEPQRSYSGPDSRLGDDPSNPDEIAVLVKIADGRFIMAFPWPVVESQFNLLILSK